MESITKRVASPPVPEVTLESKVAFLRQPASFQEPTYPVEAIDTHMSWVFLTDCHAYKLKKPVSYDFLDFSTIEARHYYCQEEILLKSMPRCRGLPGDCRTRAELSGPLAAGRLGSSRRLAHKDAAAANASNARLCHQESNSEPRGRLQGRGAACRLLPDLRTHRHRSSCIP